MLSNHILILEKEIQWTWSRFTEVQNWENMCPPSILMMKKLILEEVELIRLRLYGQIKAEQDK